MTVDIHIDTVVTAIAALSWPAGVTVKDYAGIPANGILQPRTMYPNPERLFSNFLTENETFGIQGNETLGSEYDLIFRYLFCAPVGSVGAIYNVASFMSDIIAIAQVFTTNDTVTGAQDLRLRTITDPGPNVTDPAGNTFVGCDFIIHIKEQVAP